jgi:hypothetical protein
MVKSTLFLPFSQGNSFVLQTCRHPLGLTISASANSRLTMYEWASHQIHGVALLCSYRKPSSKPGDRTLKQHAGATKKACFNANTASKRSRLDYGWCKQPYSPKHVCEVLSLS